jgi:DNA-directed RNA polymerase subunit RPC12/RpoP
MKKVIYKCEKCSGEISDSQKFCNHCGSQLMDAQKQYYIVEVEKGVDWPNGYLNYNGDVVESIKKAEKFENKVDAENAATSFNIEYGNKRIYARVR